MTSTQPTPAPQEDIMTTTLTHTQLSDQITAMHEDATYLDRLDQRAGADLLRSHAELLESTLNLL